MRNFRRMAGAPGARYALLVATLALFGLLSMHGWGTQAGLHSGDTHASAHAVMALDAHSHGTTATDRTAEGLAEKANCGNDCGNDQDGGMGLMGLCLAILVGAVLGLTLLLLRRCIPLLRTMLPALAHPVLLSRDRDPPDLLRLCVIRC